MDTELLKACAMIRRSGCFVKVVVQMLRDATLTPDDAAIVLGEAKSTHFRACKPHCAVVIHCPGGRLLHKWVPEVGIYGYTRYRTACRLASEVALDWLIEAYADNGGANARQNCRRCLHLQPMTPLLVGELKQEESP